MARSSKRSDRLQLRMDPALKQWFAGTAIKMGGMSRVVHQHVEHLYENTTGKKWTKVVEAESDVDARDSGETPRSGD